MTVLYSVTRKHRVSNKPVACSLPVLHTPYLARSYLDAAAEPTLTGTARTETALALQFPAYERGATTSTRTANGDSRGFRARLSSPCTHARPSLRIFAPPARCAVAGPTPPGPAAAGQTPPPLLLTARRGSPDVLSVTDA
jgi:hypothetical protein